MSVFVFQRINPERMNRSKPHIAHDGTYRMRVMDHLYNIVCCRIVIHPMGGGSPSLIARHCSLGAAR